VLAVAAYTPTVWSVMQELASPRLQTFAEGVTAQAEVGFPDASKQVGTADPPGEPSLLPLPPHANDSPSKSSKPGTRAMGFMTPRLAVYREGLGSTIRGAHR